MTTPIEPASVHFNQDGVPVSDTFDDIYFSTQDGAAETEYVFLAGNHLPERFTHMNETRPFVIAETGFGTGLNMLLAAMRFLEHAPATGKLHLVSFERYPLSADEIATALSHWPQLTPLQEALLAGYPALISGVHRIFLHSRITLDLHFGDVLEALPGWVKTNSGQVNAWFLDGFAPNKNPHMWQPALYQAMSDAAAPTCTLATFTAVGEVRRGLIDAGFAMNKRKGFGHKRDMLTGHKLQPENVPAGLTSRKERHIAIVGGGIAAACLARILTEQTDQNLIVTLLCADNTLASGASGNPQGAVYPLLQADFTPATQFYSQAFLYAQRFYRSFAPQYFHACGVLQMAFNDTQSKRQHHTLSRTNYPASFVHSCRKEQASALTGIPLAHGGLYFPTAGWVEPSLIVKQLVEGSRLHLHTSTRITSVRSSKGRWLLSGQQSNVVNGYQGIFDDVIFANGAGLMDFLQGALTIRPVGGQVSQVAATKDSVAIKTVICHKGYMTPANQSAHCIGATFSKLNQETLADYLSPDNASLDADNQENLTRNHRHVPIELEQLQGQRRSVRATTPDHLPIVGPHPGYGPGVWVCGGLGARGFTTAPWCAQYLADSMFKRVSAIDARIAKAINSQRQVS